MQIMHSYCMRVLGAACINNNNILMHADDARRCGAVRCMAMHYDDA